MVSKTRTKEQPSSFNSWRKSTLFCSPPISPPEVWTSPRLIGSFNSTAPRTFRPTSIEWGELRGINRKDRRFLCCCPPRRSSLRGFNPVRLCWSSYKRRKISRCPLERRFLNWSQRIMSLCTLRREHVFRTLNACTWWETKKYLTFLKLTKTNSPSL